MKIQTLNKTQQKKLLELCKEFFPELQAKANKKGLKWCKEEHQNIEDYEIGFRLSEQGHNTLVYCSYPIDYDYHIHLLKIKRIGTFGKTEDKGIHWHQLCFTELPERIFSRCIDKIGSKIPAKFFYGGIDFTGITQAMAFRFYEHPVDFLHNFVKECKKNKYFKL